MGINRHHNAALESDIAIRLTNVRRNSGIKQSTVAQHIGVTGSCVSQWELGVSYPQSWSRWQQWADAVGEKLTISLEAK